MSTQLDTISPAELIADVLKRLTLVGLEWSIVSGPATDKQQQAGVVQMVDAGLPVVELYVPTVTVRTQIRCLHGTLDIADTIARATVAALHGRGRTVARMKSTDRRYLIHYINITSGPSMHYDSAETWETLLFAESLIGTDPL